MILNKHLLNKILDKKMIVKILDNILMHNHSTNLNNNLIIILDNKNN